jgi:hypothetical protein
VATREQQSKIEQSLHASIEPENRGPIDTHHWVFFSCAPPSTLESMGSNTRLLLIASMAGLLLLTAITGGAALAAFSRIHAEENALRARTLEHSRRLDQVRTAIFLSAAEQQSPSTLIALRPP